jgi:hypothetical protein
VKRSISFSACSQNRQPQTIRQDKLIVKAKKARYKPSADMVCGSKEKTPYN